MIKIARPHFSAEGRQQILNGISEILESGQLMLGEFAQKLESGFAAKLGVRHAISVNSCTTALQICLEYFGVRGNEVLIPAAGFTTDISVVRWAGGTPVLVDVNPETMSFDLDDLARRTTGRTKGLIWVHLTGVISAEYREIMDFARERNLFVLEDCAHAQGAEIDGRRAGSIGDAACYSFFPTKLMTCGTGGMLATELTELDSFAREMRLFGRSEQSGEVIREGNDWFLDEFRACIAWSQLAEFDLMLERRRAIAARYRSALANSPGLRMPDEPSGARHAYYQFPIFLDSRLDVTPIIRVLAEKHSIQAKRIYRPLHHEPVFKHLQDGGLPKAERLLNQSLCLPIHPGLSDAEIDHVATAVVGEVRARL